MALVERHLFTTVDLAAAALVGSELTYARASAATFHDSAGVLKLASSGTERTAAHYFDGADWNNHGILLEGAARTNLAIYSEQMDNSTGWPVLARVTISADTIIAPDGETTADSILETTDTNTHHPNSAAVTVIADNYQIGSIFFKQLGRTHAALSFFGTGVIDAKALFDLSDGTVEATTGDDFISAGIEDVGDGWFRCWVCLRDSAVVSLQMLPHTNEDGVSIIDSYSGDVTKGVYAWGAMIEDVGAVEPGGPSSYVKTVASAVSRAADTLSTPVIDSDDGTLYVRGMRAWPNPGTDMVLAALDDGTDRNDEIALIEDATDQKIDAQSTITTGNAGLVEAIGSALINGTEFEAALAWNGTNNDLNAAVDGASGTEDTTADFPLTTSFDALRFSDNIDADMPYFGFITEIALFDEDKGAAWLLNPVFITGMSRIGLKIGLGV